MSMGFHAQPYFCSPAIFRIPFSVLYRSRLLKIKQLDNEWEQSSDSKQADKHQQLHSGTARHVLGFGASMHRGAHRRASRRRQQRRTFEQRRASAAARWSQGRSSRSLCRGRILNSRRPGFHFSRGKKPAMKIPFACLLNAQWCKNKQHNRTKKPCGLFCGLVFVWGCFLVVSFFFFSCSP